MQQQLIDRFQNLMTYGELPNELTAQATNDLGENETNETVFQRAHETKTNATDLNAVELQLVIEKNETIIQRETETNATDLNSAVFIQENETNATVMHAQAKVFQRENQTNTNATDLNAMELQQETKTNETIIQRETETNATDLNNAVFIQEKETNATVMHAQAKVFQRENKTNTNATDLNAMELQQETETNETIIQRETETNATDLNNAVFIQEKETNAMDLNARAMNDFMNLDAEVFQRVNETNTMDLNARATNDFIELNAVELQRMNEMNAMDFNARATNDFTELDAVELQRGNKTNATDLNNTKPLFNAPTLMNGTTSATDRLLMLRHRPQHDKDESHMIPLYNVESQNLHELLEADEQIAYDHEMAQMDYDIRRHLNDETECIIESFEKLDHSSSDNNSELYDRNDAATQDFYSHSPDSSNDDINKDIDVNTDTEDGAEDLIDLLRSNMKLIAFIKKQNATIRRLRSRIIRLGKQVYTLENIMREYTMSRQESQTSNATSPEDDHTKLIRSSTLYASSVEETRRSTQHALSGTDSSSDTPHASSGGDSSRKPLHASGVTESDSSSQNVSKRAKPTALVLMDSSPDVSLIAMGSKFNPTVHLEFLVNKRILKELKRKQATLHEILKSSAPQLWMYFDSGASRSVIAPTSPIRQHLTQSRPVHGSCSIGDGTPLDYIEKGMLHNTIDTTVVKNLRYDLFSSVSAAKQGITSIIDYNLETGENNSYMVDKLTGNIIPLIERGQGILEVPLQLMTPRTNVDASSTMTPEALLYTFDILKQLNERERDFLIHARLGHVPNRTILKMKQNGTKGLELYTGKYGELCKPCLQAKHRAKNHGKEHQRHPQGKPGEHLHSDLAVVSTLDSNGNKYVLTVVDEISCEIVIALLKTKTAEAVSRVSKKIQLIITARTGNKPRTWQFDRGTEFLNATFEQWLLLDLGVKQRFSNVEHPWENGKAERSFQAIFSLARSLLKHADLPIKMWGKAVLHAAYIMNRTPASSTGGIAPLQFRTKEALDLSNMRVFGSPAQIHVRATIREDKKLSDRSVSGTFIGHSSHGNGYLFLVPKISSSKNECDEIDSIDVKFNETFSPCRERHGKLSPANVIAPDLTTESDNDNSIDNRVETIDVDAEVLEETASDTPQYGRGKRSPVPRQFLLPGTQSTSKVTFLEPLPREMNTEFKIRDQQYANLCMDINNDEHTTFLIACMASQRDDEVFMQKELELVMACSAIKDDVSTQLEDVNLSTPDPKSQRDIDRMQPSDAKRFNDATLSEVNGMKQKGVMELRTLDSLPQHTKIYQSVVNWTSKTNLGIYVKTKCRICFGGHRYDKSSTDTFAPTVNFCTVLIMICLSAMFSWHLGSVDYSQAYLNADLDEICVMQAPQSVREFDENNKEYFWLLKKAIYGHPKSSRLWAECLHRKLLHMGYEQFLTDQCVYGKWTNWDNTIIKGQTIPDNMSFVFLLIHSDDIIIISHKASTMNAAKADLLKAFDGTDNGNLTSFCGVEIKVKENQISLSMEYYWNKLMAKFNVPEHEVEDSPVKTKILRSECPAVPDPAIKNNYLQIIGSIIYGFTHCRLDLAFPVNLMTRVMHSPAEQHYKLLHKLLRYINGTKNWDLTFYKDVTVQYGMEFVFFCCVDSAHADDDETHRSTGGWFFFLRRGQGSVAAKSGQTTDIPLSSTESETIWGSHATMQGAFIKQFLDETKIFARTSFELHEDSQPMINAQKRNVSQSRFKHIKTKHHYIRKMIFDGWCKLVKIPTQYNTADMATKILSAKATSIFSRMVLGLQDVVYYSFSID
jgi:transposase InsO family protein